MVGKNGANYYSKNNHAVISSRFYHPFGNAQLRKPGFVTYAIVGAVLYATRYAFFDHQDLKCFGWPKFRTIIQSSMTWETGGLFLFSFGTITAYSDFPTVSLFKYGLHFPMPCEPN